MTTDPHQANNDALDLLDTLSHECAQAYDDYHTAMNNEAYAEAARHLARHNIAFMQLQTVKSLLGLS